MIDIIKTTELMNRIQEISFQVDKLEQTPHVQRAQFSLQSALQELFHGMNATAEKEAANV